LGKTNKKSDGQPGERRDNQMTPLEAHYTLNKDTVNKWAYLILLVSETDFKIKITTVYTNWPSSLKRPSYERMFGLNYRIVRNVTTH